MNDKLTKDNNNPWKNGELKNHDFRKEIKSLESDTGNEKPVGREKNIMDL